MRKTNIYYSLRIAKQTDKIAACTHQIKVLSKTVKELSEGGMPRLEEKARIWKVKEKITAIIQTKTEDINNKNTQIAANQKILRVLDKEESFLKQEIRVLELEMIQHYYELLQIGIDTRQEGLSWIIKNLWVLKENIKISKLPKFLDSEAISFLLDYSKMSKELDENTKQPIRLFNTQRVITKKIPIQQQFFSIATPDKKSLSRKLSVPTLIPGTSKVSNPYSFMARHSPTAESKLNAVDSHSASILQPQNSSQALMLQVKSQLKAMANTTKAKEVFIKDPRIRHLVKQNMGRFSQPGLEMPPVEYATRVTSYLPTIDLEMTSDDHRNFSTSEMMSRETKSGSLKHLMQRAKTKELERIYKEFMDHTQMSKGSPSKCNYGGRYMVSAEIVTSALVGEELSLSDLAKLFSKS